MTTLYSILEIKSESVIWEADIKMWNPLTGTADDSQKLSILSYNTHQVYLYRSDPLLLMLHTQNRHYLLFWCTIYNVLLKKNKYITMTADTFINITIIWNYVLTYIFSPCIYQTFIYRSVKSREISLEHGDMCRRKSSQEK